MILENLVGPESTQLVKYIKNKYDDEYMSKEYSSQLKELPMAKTGKFEQINKLVLDFNS